MKLSILICSLPERAHHLANMLSLITHQIKDGVEFIVDNRPRHIPTGVKRNDLMAQAKGEWVCFVDDDDYISPDYVEEILKALESNPDVVTFKGWMTTNGISHVDWCIKLGEKYEARTDPDGITRYYRFPNHLCPMRKSIATVHTFPAIWQGEDYAWAKKIHDFGMLKTEVHIDKKLYHYRFITNK
jgi:glycosyltransferase involved in cell wall biosynthesis